jgi:hypothetical protein
VQGGLSRTCQHRHFWSSTNQVDQQLPVGEMLIKCTAISKPYSGFFYTSISFLL